MTILERDIEGPASVYAKVRGWVVTKIMRASPNGVPDRFHARRVPECPHCGNATNVLFIEYKQKGKKPTAQQLVRHAELRAAGVRVEVIDDLDDAKRILR